MGGLFSTECPKTRTVGKNTQKKVRVANGSGGDRGRLVALEVSQGGEKHHTGDKGKTRVSDRSEQHWRTRKH